MAELTILEMKPEKGIETRRADVTVVPCGQLIGRSITSFSILFDFLFHTILAAPFLVYMWLCLIVARSF
jgi:hypothetical protein